MHYYRKPSCFLALVQVELMWVDQERSEVIVTPRYLSDSTWMMGVPLMQTDKLGGKRLREMSMNLVLAGFND